MNLLIFIFVYAAPFLYTSKEREWGPSDVIIFFPILLLLAFYGLDDMAKKVANPFGWDAEDHDLESFGIAVRILRIRRITRTLPTYSFIYIPTYLPLVKLGWTRNCQDVWS